jgi:AcrR family transcriptional regulator
MSRRYHHGNLRAELLAAAVAEIDEVGPAAMSLRRVAARAGVTHPAVAHHFGDKTGLLTALAVQGHRGLAAALATTRGDLLGMGVAYLRYARDHRAEFEVMLRPELLDRDDPELLAAREAGRRQLVAGSAAIAEPAAAREIGLVAWSFVHGFCELWLGGEGGIPADADGAERLFRRLARRLFVPPPEPAR